jgi:tetrahydromethanopterin S-methyltransferase subunit B
MGDMERAVTGEHALCANPGCAQQFRDFERRIRDLEDDETVKDLQKTLTSIEKQLENLKGRLGGYLFAGGLVGTIVGALVAVMAATFAK